MIDDDDLFAIRPAPAPPPASPRESTPPAASRPRWRENPGYLPDDAKGKRVAVQLRDGSTRGEVPYSDSVKAGWEASTVRWTLLDEGHPCRHVDVLRYRVH
jgi:hypothetical protein